MTHVLRGQNTTSRVELMYLEVMKQDTPDVFRG